MLRPYDIPAWKKAPFIRILLPLIAGIILQWYLQIQAGVIIAALICFSIAFLLFLWLPIAFRYKLQPLQGFIIHLMLTGIGSLLTWQKDIRHNRAWYGNYYRDSSTILVRIDEPLVEKNKSFKAEGYVESILQNDRYIPCKGNLLLYFSKDSVTNNLRYGDRILIRKVLQPIKNSGNPGGFNYERYAAFQGIFHNVFLKERDWLVLTDKDYGKNRFKQFLFSTRQKILAILQHHIKADDPGGNRDELGIAEALLIGYTNDLDKDLVQAYSNTGVVHIIAISGMHLGLIYVLLVWLFAKVPLISQSKLMQVVLILGFLWLFSLLTGAAASVLRSAVMFTFITLGKHFMKRSSIYNSIAASAFVMLCFNPYFLWDVGFQLSYAAVVGIVVFQRPIYNCMYIKNKWVDGTWKLMSVSLAAQLLTFPACIYYFHQFPNLFLITNIIAVPLSGFILYAEIALVALSWLPFAGTYLGKGVSWLLWLMNKIIRGINDLPFSVWDKIHADVITTWMLYMVVAGFSAWLISKNKKYFQLGLVCLLFFVSLNTYNSWQLAKQQMIIVYNVPRYQAIDLVSGNSYRFIGDDELQEDALLQNFHLKPGRVYFQLNQRKDSMEDVFQDGLFYQFNKKRLMIIDRPLLFETPRQKTDIDLVIISKNPKLSISQLASGFNCKQFIFDASNPEWKIAQWQKECEDLHLPGYTIAREGAFVYDIGM